jgi:hypothetical protein
MSAVRQIRDDINLTQGRLMQTDEVAFLESFGFRRTGQEIARFDGVLC